MKLNFFSIILIFVMSFTIACSNDDNGNTTSQTDPLIGSWQTSFTGTDETEDGEMYSFTANGTFIFNADGTATSNLVLNIEGETETEEIDENYMWTNQASTPNFSATTQTYNIQEDVYTATFTSDFSALTLSEVNGDMQLLMTRN